MPTKELEEYKEPKDSFLIVCPKCGWRNHPEPCITVFIHDGIQMLECIRCNHRQGVV